MIYIHTYQVTRTQCKNMGGILMKLHETIKKVRKYSNSIKKDWTIPLHIWNYLMTKSADMLICH